MPSDQFLGSSVEFSTLLSAQKSGKVASSKSVVNPLSGLSARLGGKTASSSSLMGAGSKSPIRSAASCHASSMSAASAIEQVKANEPWMKWSAKIGRAHV